MARTSGQFAEWRTSVMCALFPCGAPEKKGLHGNSRQAGPSKVGAVGWFQCVGRSIWAGQGVVETERSRGRVSFLGHLLCGSVMKVNGVMAWVDREQPEAGLPPFPDLDTAGNLEASLWGSGIGILILAKISSQVGWEVKVEIKLH